MQRNNLTVKKKVVNKTKVDIGRLEINFISTDIVVNNTFISSYILMNVSMIGTYIPINVII